ncbi:hypothetical protein SEVIR_5G362001v4 [Setaria viridis]|uniref:4-hydroxy-7-methoxy-3-oxo-3,4-dihydro-2H-1,4-benzoxazin-2-yl glucosidebeta-D-glucosidase n=1 Tax=Setaria viridis TaxID=4556 RepID=A0A4U6UM53_SETVI|nr:hypothetical protein SEVIR_5G362001v2 [Setaria viridis]
MPLTPVEVFCIICWEVGSRAPRIRIVDSVSGPLSADRRAFTKDMAAAVAAISLLLPLSAPGAAPVLGFTRVTSLKISSSDPLPRLIRENARQKQWRYSCRRVPQVQGRGAINPKGLQYYNNLIDELVRHGVQVHVMIYQLDLPQVLEDEYGGWLNPRIVEDFTAYADVCFKDFGDRVSYWTTLDEVNVAALGSYDVVQIPLGRCSDPFGVTKCIVGNSSVEPYIAAHNMLLALASASRLYRGKYQMSNLVNANNTSVIALAMC